MADPLTPTDVLKSMLISGLNHAFTLGAAWCIQHGLFAQEIASAENVGILAAGAAAGLISIGMLLYRKASNHRLIEAARAAAPGTPMGIIEAEAAVKPLTGA